MRNAPLDFLAKWRDFIVTWDSGAIDHGRAWAEKMLGRAEPALGNNTRSLDYQGLNLALALTYALDLGTATAAGFRISRHPTSAARSDARNGFVWRSGGRHR